MKDKNLLTIVVVIAAVFLITQGGFTGYAVDPYSGLRTVPISDARFATGNADHDSSGFIDKFDLTATKNYISLNQYDAQADMDQDGDVDWTDYALLEDFIASHGSGLIVERAGVCTPGQTACGRNLASGTGSILVCEINRYGAPEFVQKSCGDGNRCRNGVCEFKQAARLH